MNETMSTFQPFRSGCGSCKPSTDYYGIPHVGGDSKSIYSKNYGIDYKTSFGGAKSKKKMRGGVSNFNNYPESDLFKEYALFNKSGGSKKKIMRGGMESSGATPLPQRFFNPNAPIDHASANSGQNALSAYGEIQVSDVGNGMLAPFTTSSNKYANVSSLQQTGGANKKKVVKGKKPSASKDKKKPVSKDKKKPTLKGKKIMKGGMESSGATPISLRFYNPDYSLEKYDPNSGNGIESAYGKISVGDVGVGMLAPYTASQSITANHNTKMQTGGGPIPRVNDNSVKSITNTINSVVDKFTGFMSQLETQYNKSIESTKNIKIGNQRLLAGGAKKKTIKNVKKMRGGNETDFKYIPDNSTVDLTSINSPKSELIGGSKKKNVKKSVKDVKNMRGGNENDLTDMNSPKTDLMGGSKKKNVKKSVKNVKNMRGGNENDLTDMNSPKTDLMGGSKKKNVKKSVKNLRGGGNGSDFALTLNSRGPANAPDAYWGVNGEQWFRQFNKTGDYIPNSQLKYEATPELAGHGNSSIVSGFDPLGTLHGAVGGSKSKSKKNNRK